MTFSEIYRTAARASGGGRHGRVVTDDGQVNVDLRMPRELGGAGNAPNPESLFAAGFAGCFMSALSVVGRSRGLDLSRSEVRTEVALGKMPDSGFALLVDLYVEVVCDTDADVWELAREASRICPYSNAIRGNVPVTLMVNGGVCEAAADSRRP